jgi:hypothetical protein
MSESWKPSIRVWPFKDAPEEFRRLCGEPDGTEELVIYIPPELAATFEDGGDGGWVMLFPPALWFLDKLPKRADLWQSAGDDFGEYSLHVLPSGARVAVTAGSQWDHRAL